MWQGPESGPLYYMSYYHTMEYYIALQMNYLQIQHYAWSSQTMLCERRQTQKSTHSKITFLKYKNGCN